MKSNIACVIICVCLLFLGCKKRYPDYSVGSGFDRTTLDSTTLNNLEVLGRVWGYVKYHHPAFAGDKYNLDYELFKLLPQVADAEPDERNRILVSWIDGFGNFITIPDKYDAMLKDSTIYEYHTDIGWIQDTMTLGSDLSKRLIRLRNAERKENYYVSLTTLHNDQWTIELGACFEHENPYNELTAPDYGFRLLTVFRFWNMIEYYFPSKHLIDKNWDEVLPEYIRRMVNPVDGDYRKEVWRMIAEINDNHAQGEYTWLFGVYRAPLHIGFVENRLVIISPDTVYTDYKRSSPFQPGDEIKLVDGQNIEYYKSLTREFVPCSNDNDILAATSDLILRSKINRQLLIRYERDGMQRDTIIAGMEMMPNSFEKTYLDRHIKAYQMMNDSIGYIFPAKYNTDDKYRIFAILERSKGLIIDLRCYPSEGFIEFIYNYIIPNHAQKLYMSIHPNILLPGCFSSYIPIVMGGKSDKYNKPIVVIVDENTQSYAEYCVQCMQTNPSVTVIGSQSAGANGNTSEFTLPGGVVSRFSGVGWYYPYGWNVQRQGVKINMKVHPTIEGITTGRDEMLESAIKIITDQQSHSKI